MIFCEAWISSRNSCFSMRYEYLLLMHYFPRCMNINSRCMIFHDAWILNRDAWFFFEERISSRNAWFSGRHEYLLAIHEYLLVMHDLPRCMIFCDTLISSHDAWSSAMSIFCVAWIPSRCMIISEVWISSRYMILHNELILTRVVCYFSLDVILGNNEDSD